MKLYQVMPLQERVVAEDRHGAFAAASDDHPDAGYIIDVDELADPMATLNLSQAEVTRLVALVGTKLSFNDPTDRPTLAKLKVKLDGAVWQIAAQKTMLQKAGEPQ